MSTTFSFFLVPVLRKVAVTVVCSPWNTRSSTSTETDAAVTSASRPPTALVEASTISALRSEESDPAFTVITPPASPASKNQPVSRSASASSDDASVSRVSPTVTFFGAEPVCALTMYGRASALPS